MSYVLQTRIKDGRQRKITIGRHGQPWTPETARDEARRLLGSIVVGIDPVAEKKAERVASPVAELCDVYLADAKAGRLLTARRASKNMVDELDRAGGSVRDPRPGLDLRLSERRARGGGRDQGSEPWRCQSSELSPSCDPRR